MRKTFTTLQAGRGLAAVLVVLFHCTWVLLHNWHHSFTRFLKFGHSGVEFFFVLSGIVILHAHRADIGNPEALGKYSWKRFRRIYPIYWVVLATVLPSFFLVHSFGVGYERNPQVILQSALLVYLFNGNTVLGVSWTLFHEVMFYVLFGVLILNRRLGTSLLGLWLLLSISTLVWAPHNLLANYGSPLNILFFLGMAVTLLLGKLPSFQIPAVLLGVGGFATTAVLENIVYGPLNDTRIEPSTVYQLAYGLSAAVAMLGVMQMEYAGRIRATGPMKLLGDASYSIYLVHFPFVSIAGKALYPIWAKYPTPYIVPFLILAASAILAGVAVHLLIEKPILARMQLRANKRDKDRAAQVHAAS